MTELETIVLSELENNLSLSRSILASKYSRSERTIQRVLNSLKEKGLIKRVDPLKGGHWEIIK